MPQSGSVRMDSFFDMRSFANYRIFIPSICDLLYISACQRRFYAIFCKFAHIDRVNMRSFIHFRISTAFLCDLLQKIACRSSKSAIFYILSQIGPNTKSSASFSTGNFFRKASSEVASRACVPLWSSASARSSKSSPLGE